MRHRILLPSVIGFALVVAGASMNCGGDDDGGATAAGTAGSSTGGRGGSGGSGGSATTTTGGGNGGSGGSGGSTGGSAGTGGRGGSGGSSGGSAGTAGSGGQRDAGDSGTADTSTPDTSTPDTSTPDAKSDTTSSDAPVADAAPDTTTSDRPDGSVAFAQVTDIFNRRCSGCHKPRETGQQLLDLVTADGLYTRLTSPLPSTQEGTCGFPAADAGDAGDDGGDGAVPPNRQPIVPGDTDGSLLFRKVSGTQPTGCFARMPRVNVFNDDGGPAGSVGCDTADGGAAANCLSQADLDTIRDWITQGASQN